MNLTKLNKMKALISFCVISLLLFTGITGKDTTAPKSVKEIILKEKKVLDKLSFKDTLSKPSDSLLKQVKRLDRSLRHAEYEIKEHYSQETHVKIDTLVKKDSVLIKKKSFLKKVIDRLK
jgi:hypothetical protein